MSAVHSPNGLRYVAKSVDSGPTDRLLVCFEQFQQLKTYPHPLLSRNKLCPPISNPANQINAVLLYLLVPVRKCRERQSQSTVPRGVHMHVCDKNEWMKGMRKRKRRKGADG